jgi:hypothetical protein
LSVAENLLQFLNAFRMHVLLRGGEDSAVVVVIVVLKERSVRRRVVNRVLGSYVINEDADEL